MFDATQYSPTPALNFHATRNVTADATATAKRDAPVEGPAKDARACETGGERAENRSVGAVGRPDGFRFHGR